MLRLLFLCFTLGVSGVLAAGAFAGKTDVIDVKVQKTGPDTFSFDVTVRHADTGWKHYANKWDIVSADGKVLGTRILHHPHVNEQPFTRSLSGVKIAPNISAVTIRAYDSKHGSGGAMKTVTLPR